jgi:hypothetical protein
MLKAMSLKQMETIYKYIIAVISRNQHGLLILK